MKNKKIMGIITAMTLVLMGGASAMTAKAWVATGIDPDPCPECHTGTVWHYQEHYKKLIETRVCEDGFTEGTDAHYQNIYLYKTQCIDCSKYLELEEVEGSDYWECHGYNTPPEEEDDD